METRIEQIIIELQNKLKLFPDEEEMSLYERGLYDGYLNSLKLVVEMFSKNK
jgi:hypothetical protein